MKIIITGSHFTPAQAVIDELLKNPKIEISYIGRSYTREGDKTPSIESEVLPKLGVKFIPLTTGRLQRSFTIYTIPSLFKIPFGFLQAFYLLLQEKPSVVLSFGGYTAVPVVIAAWLLSIPIIIHEQTLISGLANKISSIFADKIAVSFLENTSFEDCKKIVLTGNPLRKEILEIKSPDDMEIKEFVGLAKKEKLLVVLITGGNQGSHLINETVGRALEDLLQHAFVIHQTGDSKFQDFEKMDNLKNDLKLRERYLVRKWFHSDIMGYIFKNVDLVVSRAGMNTLTELAYFGIPVLLIPIPYLYKNEQGVNANFFNKLGLAEVILQKDLTPETLLKTIKGMIKEIKLFKTRAEQAKQVVIPDAAKRLALETVLLAEKLS